MDARLSERMQELKDLQGLIALAVWDQETYLPPKAMTARGQQLACAQALYHEKLVDPALGDWLEAHAGPDEVEAAMVRVLRRERERAVRLPRRLVKALSEAQAAGLTAWKAAREADDERRFEDALDHLVALRREEAQAHAPPGGELYDGLLEGYEPGMRVERLRPVLLGLAEKLQPLVERLGARPPPPDVFEGQRFDEDAQWRFSLTLLEAMGFDLEAGRQDRSTHPFSSASHPSDVRLTNRLSETNPASAIFSALHEGGHGLYEQGFAWPRSPLASGASMGLHESQSRLWENLVGRSRAFWEFQYPRFQQAFPLALGAVSLDAFLASITQVRRTPIRVEADEVTYNLHIVLRFELELQLLRGSLKPRELPQAWAELTRTYLGLEVRSPRQGVLQDIHWAYGEFGYFPTYALGNLYAASLWRAAGRALPGLEDLLREGQLLPLRDWLRAHVHAPGARWDAEELVTRVTGRGLNDEDFLSVLQERYGGG